MKILLTTPPLNYYNSHSFLFKDQGCLSLAQIAASVADENEIEIFDNTRSNSFTRLNTVIDRISKFNPDIIGISNSARMDTLSTISLANNIRKVAPNAVIIGGGLMARYDYPLLLANNFDFIVLGEGDVTFKKIIFNLKNKNHNFSNIKGIAYLENKKIIKNNTDQLTKNLDDTPYPRIDLLPLVKSKIFPQRYTASLETSRGCSYGCDFCTSSAAWDHTYRKKSNSRIINEILNICKLIKKPHIYIIDDCFGFKVDEYKDLMKIIIKKQLDIKWWAMIRADIIADNEELIELCAKAGMYSVFVGFESWNSNDLANAGKTIDVKKNITASQILKKHNVFIIGHHMLGIPGQKSFKHTYNQGRKYSDLFWITQFKPNIGTKSFITHIKNSKKNVSYISSSSLLLFLYWIRIYLSPKTLIQLLLSKKNYYFKMHLSGYRARIEIIGYWLLYIFKIRR